MTLDEAVAEIRKSIEEQSLRMTEALANGHGTYAYEMGARHGLREALEIMQQVDR